MGSYKKSTNIIKYNKQQQETSKILRITTTWLESFGISKTTKDLKN